MSQELLGALREAALCLSVSQSRDVTLAQVLTCVRTVISADAALIFLRTEGGQFRIIPAASKSPATFVLESTSPLADLLIRGQPLLSNLDAAPRPVYLSATLQAVIGVPLHVQHQLIGGLALFSDTLDHFTTDQLEILDVFAGLVATALRTEQTQVEIAAERQKMQAQQDELARLKERFIAMVSHELRTPLSIIAVSSEVLRKYGDRMDAQRREGHFRKIQDTILHMEKLTNRVISTSTVGKAVVTLERSETDLLDLAQQTITDFRVGEGFDYPIVMTHKGLPRMVRLNANFIQEILANLLSNAVKYSPAGSPISLQIEFQTEEVLLSVVDQGDGIPEADQPHLFEPFFRGSNAGSTSGTGLGLTVVQQAVDLHGGTVNFETLPGQGTTFTVRLPG
jgi:signal transduction histidine kinase